MNQSNGVRELEMGLIIADLSGYTAFTERHGALHAAEVVLEFQRIARASLLPGVRLINSIGDDVFCAGSDVVAVARTALQLRDAVAQLADFPKVRTGVHCGRIVEREGQFFGAPINLAARVAGLAVGGQVLCTEDIAIAVRGVEGIASTPIGTRRFRNVPRDVGVFELTPSKAQLNQTVVDPVCRMQVQVEVAAGRLAHEGRVYHFCSLKCAGAFAKSPETYLVHL